MLSSLRRFLPGALALVLFLLYVGASDVTSFLIATAQGHILLDGGFAETAPQIEANVEKLGFKLSDVKVLQGKAKRLAAGESPNPFIDSAGCRAYVRQMERAYEEQLRKEKKAALP